MRGEVMVDVDDAVVARVARRALNVGGAALLDYVLRPLTYDTYRPGRTVIRVVGHADVGSHTRPWSAVLKRTDSPRKTPSAPVEGARREALAYGSGLLERAGALGTPRAFEIDMPEDGHVALWLEDVRATHDAWPLETYRVAARALGRFNAAFLARPLPDHEWFVGDWAKRQSEPLDVATALEEVTVNASSDGARRALGHDIGRRAARMLEDQPLFVEDLARLPQTLCHHDASRSNLIATPRRDGRTEIVAVDWESVGPGALGAEAATLVSGSVRKGDFPADQIIELDAAVFEAYLAGLRDEGWHGDRGAARLGYAMSLGLRFWFVRDTLRTVASPDITPRFGRASDVPAADVLRAFALLSRFLLDRADEARSLAVALLHRTE